MSEEPLKSQELAVDPTKSIELRCPIAKPTHSILKGPSFEKLRQSGNELTRTKTINAAEPSGRVGDQLSVNRVTFSEDQQNDDENETLRNLTDSDNKILKNLRERRRSTPINPSLATNSTRIVTLNNRRTSLPVTTSSGPPSSRSTLFLLQSQISNARGLLMDLLVTNKRDLSSNVSTALRAIAQLLSPQSNTPSSSALAYDVPKVVESPFTGDLLQWSKKPPDQEIFANRCGRIVTQKFDLSSSAAKKQTDGTNKQQHFHRHLSRLSDTSLCRQCGQTLNNYYNQHNHENLKNAKMRTRSGTIGIVQEKESKSEEKEQPRKERRGVSIGEVEFLHFGRGGNCDSCRSILYLCSSSKPRVSNILFSTVTSATGLPTIAAEPSKARSNSLWKSQFSSAHHHLQQKEGAEQDFEGESDETSLKLPAPDKNLNAEDQIEPTLSISGSKIGGTVSKNIFAEEKQKCLEVGGSTEGLNNSSQEVDHKPLQSPRKNKSMGALKSLRPQRRNRRDPDLISNELPKGPIVEEDACCSSGSDQSVSSPPDSELNTYRTMNGTLFDRSEIERDQTLQEISEWSFPIFRFAEKHKRTILTRMTYTIFKEANLFRIFKLSFTKFFNYFNALESGYWDIPYHNRIHAADVLHGTYYLTCHPVIPSLNNRHYFSDDDGDEYDEEQVTGCSSEDALDACFSAGNKLHHHSSRRHFKRNSSDVSPVPLSHHMSPLELLALYTAAAMHDYDHPGRTNAFLVATEDPKAILYNDRSVLENHHASESWKLLSQIPNFFIENLDAAEIKRFRYLVLEYILATDLKQHFDIIMQFNERVPDMDLCNESDRVLISLMIIKFADINSPAKPYPLHQQWTERICKEFYEQGDEERARQMLISPYMDRGDPAVAKLQDSFIAHIVNPLAIALNDAKLLPVLPGLPESELIINLKHNHQKWLLLLDEQKQEDPTKPTSSGMDPRLATAVPRRKKEVNNESNSINSETKRSSPNRIESRSKKRNRPENKK